MFCTECGAAVSDGARFCPSCGATTPGTVPQRVRPAAVTLLAVLKIVTSLFWLLLAGIWTIAWQTAPEGGPVAGAFTVIALTLAVLTGWCAYGLWTLKPSGRVLQIALSCLGLVLGFPIGTIVSIGTSSCMVAYWAGIGARAGVKAAVAVAAVPPAGGGARVTVGALA